MCRSHRVASAVPAQKLTVYNPIFQNYSKERGSLSKQEGLVIR